MKIYENLYLKFEFKTFLDFYSVLRMYINTCFYYFDLI